MVAFTRRRILGAGAVGVAAIGASRVIGSGSEVTEGRSRARPVRADTRPPKEADVVVIGGGNMGAAAAYYLAKRGLSVVLCEKGAIAGEASGRSVGHAAALGTGPELAALALEARKLWPGLNAELGEETGYRRAGMLMQVREEGSRDYWKKWIADAGPIGEHARILDTREAAMFVKADKPWFAAAYDPMDGQAEPRLIAPAYALAARRLGAKIVAPCAVRGLEVAGGQLIGVVTEHGVIKTRRAIYAGGAWTSAFMRHLGLRVPTANLFSWCTSFGGVSGPKPSAIFDQVTARPQIDGNFTGSVMELTYPVTPDTFRYSPELYAAWKGGDWPVSPRVGWYSFKEFVGAGDWKNDEISPFEKRRILEPTVNGGIVKRIDTQLRQSVPALRDLRQIDAWGGVISMTTDQQPVIGPVPGISGLTVAASISSGVLLAPAVGTLLADIATGKSPVVDIKAFSIERFAT